MPEVRFDGFTGDWKQSKVGDFYFFKNGLNKGKEFFGSGTPIVNFTDVFHNRDICFSKLKGRVQLNENEIKNYEVKKGDIFFTRTSETIEEIGYPSVMTDQPCDTVFSGFVLRGRAINEDPLEINFKRYVFFTEKFREEMKKKSSMTTRALTSGTAIKEMEFCFPISKEEQERIGNFLKYLDNTIALHQQELTTLKRTKQGFLQKMFPKEGESVPEVRFNGFIGDWEERKFGDIYDVVSGFAFKMSDYVQVGVPIINGESIQHGSISTNNLNFLPEEFSDKYQNVTLETGDIVLGLNRPITNGNLKIAQVPIDLHGALLYQRAGKIIILNNTDINFSFHLLGKEVSSFVLKEAVGSDQPFISTTKLKKWSIRIPTKEEEQTKIGLFFKKIDDTIALHQREIDALKETKKAFLQKMFV